MSEGGPISPFNSLPGSLEPEDVRRLFEDYLRMYASRDDELNKYFSEDFTGFTGGGDFLVKDKSQWVAITRQDFAQVKQSIRIEVKDVAVQSLAETVAVATGFFTIHLPIKDHILSRETARLVLIFRREAEGWRICHSGISIPYHLVREGEVYPMQELAERNQYLEQLVEERTAQVSAANEELLRANAQLTREVDERALTEAALQRSEERYRSILNASPDNITITDNEGRIVMVSPAAISIFGSRLTADPVGRNVLEYLVPEDRERALAQIALKRRGVVTGTNEYRGLLQDGGSVDLEVNSEFIPNQKGEPTGMVIIVRDITERKKAAAEAQRLEAQNRQLQKAESLGRMAGAIAHHFNNQLHAVMMSLEMAMRDLPPDAEIVDSMAMAMRSAREAAGVSGLMLTYLGHATMQRTRLDLSQVCRHSLAFLNAVIPKGVLLDTELPEPGPGIFADENQIQHALTNLVTNAWESSGDTLPAIKLSVRTAQVGDISPMHRFPVDFQPGTASYACLEVADSGQGIREEEIEKIFDPFYSSKFPGRGMGLAVVLGIVRALEGVITVDSQAKLGSVFRVYLPVAAEAKDVPAEIG